MNYSGKAALLTIALGGMFMAADSNAAFVAYTSAANAPGRCQAFTPGPTNTIRNRVIGSENIGAPMAVACDFEVEVSGTSTNAVEVEMWFSNTDSSSAAKTIVCTMLNGWRGADGAVAVNKSAVVSYGTQMDIVFNADDTPDPADTDLSFVLVGVNCTLPTNTEINDTYVSWFDENGV